MNGQPRKKGLLELAAATLDFYASGMTKIPDDDEPPLAVVAAPMETPVCSADCRRCAGVGHVVVKATPLVTAPCPHARLATKE